MTTRDAVYRAINSERDYQSDKWGAQFEDSKWSLSDWLVFIERYTQEAKSGIGNPLMVLDSIRKIAALAVACMEHNGAPLR